MSDADTHAFGVFCSEFQRKSASARFKVRTLRSLCAVSEAKHIRQNEELLNNKFRDSVVGYWCCVLMCFCEDSIFLLRTKCSFTSIQKQK